MKNQQEKNIKMANDRKMKLFRTSTTCLFDPVDISEGEKVAAPVKTMQNHMPNFSAQIPEDFLIKDAKIAHIEDMMALSRPLKQHYKKAQRNNNQKIVTESKQVSPKNQKKKEIQNTDNFSKIQNILKEATNGHKNMKLKLQSLKNEQKQLRMKLTPLAISPKSIKTRKQVRSLTPSPKNVPRSSKFLITGSMTQRYNKRQTELAQQTFQQKLTKAQKQLAECTFKPTIVAKAVSMRILAQRERRSHASTQAQKAQFVPEGNNVFIRFQQRSGFDMPKRPVFQFEQFRTLIKYELERVQLDHQK